MGKPAIRVSEAEAANDLRSLLVRVSAGAEFVIERNAEAVAVLRPAAPNIRLLSESLRLASERGSNTTLEVHSRTHHWRQQEIPPGHFLRLDEVVGRKEIDKFFRCRAAVSRHRRCSRGLVPLAVVLAYIGVFQARTGRC